MDKELPRKTGQEMHDSFAPEASTKRPRVGEWRIRQSLANIQATIHIVRNMDHDVQDSENKQSWSGKKIHPGENAAYSLRGIFDILLEDKGHEHIFENVRRDLEKPGAPAVSCVAKETPSCGEQLPAKRWSQPLTPFLSETNKLRTSNPHQDHIAEGGQAH